MDEKDFANACYWEFLDKGPGLAKVLGEESEAFWCFQRLVDALEEIAEIHKEEGCD